MEGMILRAISGFYDVLVPGEAELIRCRARGKFRHQGLSPLVGDKVEITLLSPGVGMVDKLLPRRNFFQRPAVANMEQMIIIASCAIPKTDPFLIDRVISLAEKRGCEPVVVVNKCDLAPGEPLAGIYQSAGIATLLVSAQSGQGIDALRERIAGRVNVFTGNSGVGKSSLLNCLEPGLRLQTGEVSHALGRGRHTTRHIELFRLSNGAIVADTPGFSSFDSEQGEQLQTQELAHSFREFRPYLGECRFVGCSHVKEKGCAVLQALQQGQVQKSRHDSYVRLYQQAKEYKPWEHKD